jgi:hypothetical protein
MHRKVAADMRAPLILSIELGARHVCAVLATQVGMVLERHQRVVGEVERAIVSWIGGVHEFYGADVVVVSRRSRHWTPTLVRVIEGTGACLELLDSKIVAQALRQERALRDVVWARRLGLQSALLSVLQNAGKDPHSIRWAVRGWAIDQHRWATHCLEAEDFDEVCRAGQQVPF